MPGQMPPMQGKINLVIEVAKEGMKKVQRTLFLWHWMEVPARLHLGHHLTAPLWGWAVHREVIGNNLLRLTRAPLVLVASGSLCAHGLASNKNNCWVLPGNFPSENMLNLHFSIQPALSHNLEEFNYLQELKLCLTSFKLGKRFSNNCEKADRQIRYAVCKLCLIMKVGLEPTRA